MLILSPYAWCLPQRPVSHFQKPWNVTGTRAYETWRFWFDNSLFSKLFIIIIIIMRVCHPNDDSYKDLTPEQVYRLHENEKKRMYERRVLEVEQASFTPLVFTTTGGMGRKCLRYHSRLAELISLKKGGDYAKTLTWIRGKVFLSILRSALLCLRGSRSIRRRATKT